MNWIGKSSELKLHCFCLFDAYSMPKDICSVSWKFLLLKSPHAKKVPMSKTFPCWNVHVLNHSQHRIMHMSKCSHDETSALKWLMPKCLEVVETFSHKYNFRSLWCSSSNIQKMLFTPSGGFGCQNSHAKNFLVKIYPYKYNCRSLW